MASYYGEEWDPVETCPFQKAWSRPLCDTRNIKPYFYIPNIQSFVA